MARFSGPPGFLTKRSQTLGQTAYASSGTSAASPTVATDNFRGLFTLATCILMPVDTDETCRFEFRGDGRGASVLSLGNQFWVRKPGTTADTVWQNKAAPFRKAQPIFASIASWSPAGAMPQWGFARPTD